MIAYLRTAPGLGIAVEERDRPGLRSRPVILGGLPHQRGLVGEVNAEAHQRGARPGMTLAQAQQYCPEGVFLVPDRGRYDTVWASVLEIVQTYTPCVEPVEPGRVVFDLSGSERHWRDNRQMGSAIVESVYRHTGLAPSLGMGSGRLVAELASRIPGERGVTHVDVGMEVQFLSDLPVELLPDLDQRLALSMQVLGIRTIGQIAGLPARAMEQRFGALGKRLHSYARGVDPRPIVPLEQKPVIAHQRQCDEGTIEEAIELIHALADRCAADLEDQGVCGRLIEVTLQWRLPGNGANHASKALPEPAPHPTLPEISGHVRSALPIPYRIHSMLPQPGTVPPGDRGAGPVFQPERESAHMPLQPREHNCDCLEERGTTASLRTVIRTGARTAAPLIEHGQRLLVRLWTRECDRLDWIGLSVSEFESPKQLAFAQCARLGGNGTVESFDPGRRQAIEEQEQVLATRYGDAGFRHVVSMDASSVLTERRVQWQAGLRWRPDESGRSLA